MKAHLVILSLFLLSACGVTDLPQQHGCEHDMRTLRLARGAPDSTWRSVSPDYLLEHWHYYESADTTMYSFSWYRSIGDCTVQRDAW